MAGKSEKSAGNGTGKAAKARTTSRATTTRKPTATRRQAKVITNEAIAQRAYEIYEAGSSGSDVEHWLQAEHELRV